MQRKQYVAEQYVGGEVKLYVLGMRVQLKNIRRQRK